MCVLNFLAVHELNTIQRTISKSNSILEEIASVRREAADALLAAQSSFAFKSLCLQSTVGDDGEENEVSLKEIENNFEKTNLYLDHHLKKSKEILMRIRETQSLLDD